MKKLLFIIVFVTAVGFTIVFWQNRPEFTPETNENAVSNLVRFLNAEMIATDGGVKTTYVDQPYDEQAELTVGHATLSESQGLLLEYAIKADNQELFLTTLTFITEQLQLPDGNFAWRISGDRSQKPTFTATIDDLQIIEQVYLASEKWPELESQLILIVQAYAQTFFEFATENKFLVDGYTSEYGEKTNTLLISYLDFTALEAIKTEMGLAEEIEMDEIIRQGKALINDCYISEDFPFYYQRFYIKGYLIEEKPEINMIESMLVVKHLAEIDEVEKTTLEWLHANIESGIFSAYSPTGEPATTEQSSAVYAIVAQIAQSINDEWLYEQAMAKIWQYQIQTPDSPLSGALGEETTQTVIAYDQLQTLIATIYPKEKR
ncbi:MAG: hypothetical protein ACRC3A_01430 [Culicoidibacterales bacterium]